MLTSIEVLTAENETFLNDLKKANQELADIRYSNKDHRQATSNPSPDLRDIQKKLQLLDSNTSFLRNIESKQTAILGDINNLRNAIESGNSEKCLGITGTSGKQSAGRMRSRKLLVIGDYNEKGCGLIFKNMTERSFDINFQCRFGSLLEEVVTEACKLSENSTEDDWIVVFPGFENAKRGVKVDCKQLQKLSKTKPNVIMVLPPYSKNRPILNNFIYQQNMQIREHLGTVKKDVKLLGSENFYDSSDGYLSYSGKQDLIWYLSKKIILKQSQEFDKVEKIQRMKDGGEIDKHLNKHIADDLGMPEKDAQMINHENPCDEESPVFLVFPSTQPSSSSKENGTTPPNKQF